MPVYKKPNGTYYVSFYYKENTGKSIRKKKEGFLKKKDAITYMETFIAKNEGRTEMSFSSFVEIYLEDAKARTRETTFDNKQCLIKSRILPYFENMKLTDIEPLHIRQWQNKLKLSGYKETYLRTINNQLNAIFNYAVRYYNLSSAPTSKVEKMGKKNTDKMLFWTKEEFYNFKKYLNDDILYDLIFTLLFFTGLREGELLALTLDDINFDKKKLFVRRSYQRLKGKDVFTPPKTPKSKREITLSSFLCEAIRKYVEKRYDYKSDERLFPITKTILNRKLKSIVTKYNLKKIRIHDFRHSHVALLIELNVPILLISERLGHDNPETTLRIYGHLYPNKHEEIAILLNDLEYKN